jgi:hypothetical protein
MNPSHPRNIYKKKKVGGTPQTPKQRKRFNNSKILKIKKDIQALLGVHAAAFFLTDGGAQSSRLQTAFSTDSLEQFFGTESIQMRFIQQCNELDSMKKISQHQAECANGDYLFPKGSPKGLPLVNMKGNNIQNVFEEFVKCQSQVRNWSNRLNDAALALAAACTANCNGLNNALHSTNGHRDAQVPHPHSAARIVMRKMSEVECVGIFSGTTSSTTNISGKDKGRPT